MKLRVTYEWGEWDPEVGDFVNNEAVLSIGGHAEVVRVPCETAPYEEERAMNAAEAIAEWLRAGRS